MLARSQAHVQDLALRHLSNEFCRRALATELVLACLGGDVDVNEVAHGESEGTVLRLRELVSSRSD